MAPMNSQFYTVISLQISKMVHYIVYIVYVPRFQLCMIVSLATV